MQRKTVADLNLQPVNTPAVPPLPIQYGPGPYAPTLSHITKAARNAPTLPELLHALRRRVVLVSFFGLLVGSLLALVVWSFLPAGKHQVKALLRLKDTTPLIQGVKTTSDFDSFKQTQGILIKTRRVLDRVVNDDKVKNLPEIASRADPVRRLEEGIELKWESPLVLAVIMTGDDPNQIRTMVDVLLEHYLKEVESEEGKAKKQQAERLDRVLERVKSKNKLREEEIETLMKSGVAPDAASNQLRLQVLQDQFRSAFNETETHRKELAELKNKQGSVKEAILNFEKREIPAEDLARAVENNEDVKPKLAARRAMKQELDAMRKSAVEGSPILRAAVTRYETLDAEVREAIEKIRPHVQADLRASMKKELELESARLQEKIDTHENAQKDLESRIVLLDKQLKELQKGALQSFLGVETMKPDHDLQMSLEREKLGLMVEKQPESRISIWQNAEVTLNQNLRMKIMAAAFAFIFGLMASAGLIGYLDWRGRRVDSISQVVDEIGLRVLGSIPAFPSRASLRSGEADRDKNCVGCVWFCVNSIRTMLLHTARSQIIQVVMVTSAMQGEGKTSLAGQLSTSLATAGLRTLVLDCDMRNPSMHKLFDAPLSPGCAEVLIQEVDVSEAIQPTSIPDLWLIPAGHCSTRVIAALAQVSPLETLFNRLRGQFDFIVVDSCPILPVADSLLVGQHVDAAVISLLQDISQIPKVLIASEKLTLLNIPLLGAVLNGVQQEQNVYGYNYVKQLPA